MSRYPDFVDSDCRSNYSYFWTADYMRNAYHCTAIITVPLSLFTFFAIWKVTPSRMKTMKGPLMVSHVWSTNLDLMFTVYTAPLVFFPSASGLPLGLFTAIGIPTKWQAYWGQVSVISKSYQLLLKAQIIFFFMFFGFNDFFHHFKSFFFKFDQLKNCCKYRYQFKKNFFVFLKIILQRLYKLKL